MAWCPYNLMKSRGRSREKIVLLKIGKGLVTLSTIPVCADSSRLF